MISGAKQVNKQHHQVSLDRSFFHYYPSQNKFIDHYSKGENEFQTGTTWKYRQTFHYSKVLNKVRISIGLLVKSFFSENSWERVVFYWHSVSSVCTVSQPSFKWLSPNSKHLSQLSIAHPTLRVVPLELRSCLSLQVEWTKIFFWLLLWTMWEQLEQFRK